MSQSLPDIDFRHVRPLNGRLSDGFEELACQLAALEERPAGSDFIRKGKGRDGGLECLVRFPDGSEHGWQVKCYWAFDANLTKSLNASLDAALKKHPNLVRVTVCIPFDLSDARGAKETPRQAFDAWRAAWVEHAASQGRQLDIVLWGAFELGGRLTSDSPLRTGRILYWFGTKHLTGKWFAEQFARVHANLGVRYTAETNVTLPVRRALLGLSRNPEALRELIALRGLLREAAGGVYRDCELNEPQREMIDRVARLLDAVEDVGAASWPIKRWRDEAEAILGVVRQLYHAYWEATLEPGSTAGVDTPQRRALGALRRSLDALNSLLDLLSEPLWSMADARAVLITGEAGAGKSHLMADSCLHQVDKGRPALLFMGSSLTEGAIWPQLIAQLDLPVGYTRDTLLGALDAAGEAAGVRALVMIDAINEQHGHRIWPDRLGAFLLDAARFPHVAVVLSCRSTYLPHVVPEGIGEESLRRLDHVGFSTRDARAYLNLRGIVLPDHPFLDAELRNPLFLKSCCDALKRQGEARFPKGIRGVSAVFDMFRDAVCGEIERRLKLNERRKIPGRAIDALAHEVEGTRDTYISYERAAEIVDSIYGGAGAQEGDLLFQLETEGVISTEAVQGAAGVEDKIRFTFDRFTDHMVARAILEETLVSEQLPMPLPAESSLAKAFLGNGVPWGVQEALAIQVPERTGVELDDALLSLPGARACRFVSPESIRLRAPASVSKRTLTLLKEGYGWEAVWDALIRLSIDSESSYDAYWLHRALSAKAMPQRDSGWSIHIAQSGDDTEPEMQSALLDLIEWARDVRVGAVEPHTARLAAITLTWCLTTSNRRARDTATMALVSLLTAVPEAATELLELFGGVDDPYVGERLAAAIYGAALQGSWSEAQLKSIAVDIGERFFVRGPLPVDLLWRDHLSSLLQYAEFRGCTDIVPGGTATDAPFASEWPLEPVTDEEIEGYTRTYGSGYVSTDEIVSSTGESGDFGCYVIRYAVNGWSPATRGISPLPTTSDLFYTWKAEFDSYATATMADAFEAMNSARGEGRGWMYESGELADRHRELEVAFRQSIGSDNFERYRVMAYYWRPESDSRQVDAYSAEFDLPWAQRWVCKRAHGLGWREDLHSQFDDRCGHDRMDHRQERVGKKYQWIAFRELMARISDNCAATEGDWQKQHRETVLRLRDIDPSRLMEASFDWGWASFYEPTFWMPHVLKPAGMALPEAWDWLDGERDTLDGVRFVELDADNAGQRWLPLGSFQSFHRAGTTEDTERIGRKTWLRLDCFVVRASDVDAALDYLKDRLFLNSHELGFSEDAGADYFLGEQSWRNPSGLDWTRSWGSRATCSAPVEARATTYQFRQEAGGYDYSLKKNVAVQLPASWILDALRLRLADGRNVQYVDDKNRTVVFDPSVTMEGASVALVLRDALLTMCKREGLVPIWVLGGAKEVHVQNRPVFGRKSFTSVYVVANEGIERRHHIVSEEGRREES